MKLFKMDYVNCKTIASMIKDNDPITITLKIQNSICIGRQQLQNLQNGVMKSCEVPKGIENGMKWNVMEEWNKDSISLFGYFMTEQNSFTTPLFE